jgi:ribosomal protein L15E
LALGTPRCDCKDIIPGLVVGRDHEYWLGKSDSLKKGAIQVVPEFHTAVEGSGNKLERISRIQERRGDLRGMSSIGVRRGATKGRDGQG